jgi:hypothetical protein
MTQPTDPIPFRPRARAQRYEPEPPRPRGRPQGLPPAPGEPTQAQRVWLRRGLNQPGGKLPLFDYSGQRVDQRTIRSCIDQGWAEPWFDNPTKPDWLVCRLTDKGRALFTEPGS